LFLTRRAGQGRKDLRGTAQTGPAVDLVNVVSAAARDGCDRSPTVIPVACPRLHVRTGEEASVADAVRKNGTFAGGKATMRCFRGAKGDNGLYSRERVATASGSPVRSEALWTCVIIAYMFSYCAIRAKDRVVTPVRPRRCNFRAWCGRGRDLCASGWEGRRNSRSAKELGIPGGRAGGKPDRNSRPAKELGIAMAREWAHGSCRAAAPRR
jgi:hypothetical protein